MSILFTRILVVGKVGFGEKEPKKGFGPVRRVLTFANPSFEGELLIVGPIALALHLSSSSQDTDVSSDGPAAVRARSGRAAKQARDQGLAARLAPCA